MWGSPGKGRAVPFGEGRGEGRSHTPLQRQKRPAGSDGEGGLRRSPGEGSCEKMKMQTRYSGTEQRRTRAGGAKPTAPRGPGVTAGGSPARLGAQSEGVGSGREQEQSRRQLMTAHGAHKTFLTMAGGPHGQKRRAGQGLVGQPRDCPTRRLRLHTQSMVGVATPCCPPQPLPGTQVQDFGTPFATVKATLCKSSLPAVNPPKSPFKPSTVSGGSERHTRPLPPRPKPLLSPVLGRLAVAAVAVRSSDVGRHLWDAASTAMTKFSAV